jgi:hypothetical protein
MARPASGVHLFLLDDEGVVFDEFRQEVLALNTAATAIWCLMEQGSGKAAIEDTLRAMFDLDPEQAATFTATARWRIGRRVACSKARCGCRHRHPTNHRLRRFRATPIPPPASCVSAITWFANCR